MVEIMGLPFYSKGMRNCVSELNHVIDEEDTYNIVTTANPEMVVRSLNDEDVRKTLHLSRIIVPDGIGISIVAKITGKKLPKIAGIDLIENLLKKREVSKTITSIYMLGSTTENNHIASELLQKKFKMCRVVGNRNGYFDVDDTKAQKEIVNDINKNKPDILLIAMGIPKQERFLSLNHQVLEAKIQIGCGGCFDVWSNHKKRAPHWIRKIQCEWAYRLIQEPKRITRQYTIPLFIFHTLSFELKRRFIK